MNISSKDRARLRALAGRQVELAAAPRNLALYRAWEQFRSRAGSPRPMIRIELNTFEQDVLPPMMACEGSDARGIERALLAPYVNHVLFEDDTLMPAYFPVFERCSFTPFGLETRRQTTDGVGHHFIPYLHNLEEDYPLLGDSVCSIDSEHARQVCEAIDAIFGDLLPVRRSAGCLGACPTQDIVHIMNMDDMFMAMYDAPELFHRMMARLTDDYLAFFRMLQSGGHIRSAAKDQHLNQGSYCFTDELPDGKAHAALKECWLYMDSQETSGISPDMYGEFVFPYYEKIMREFGLVSYGCCEATHPIWDRYLSSIPNLRKVSISPWCDEEFMGEKLRGSDITYLRKPPATLLGVGESLDEGQVRACFKKTARAAQGCRLEIAQRDVYQIHGTTEKVRQYVRIARAEVER